MHELGALSLGFKIKCDCNPPTWMNMSIDERFHIDEFHFCMDELHL